jgi:spermidine synthase
MSDSYVEYDNFIRHEMLAHPALFTHKKAADIAIMNSPHDGVANEVLKHPAVTTVLQVSSALPAQIEYDERLTYFIGTDQDWLDQIGPASFDVIILPENTTDIPLATYQAYLQTLREKGILLVHGESFFVPGYFNSMYTILKEAGFYEMQVLHFPQPSAHTGMRSAVMAIKSCPFLQVSETAVFNKPFATRYYNFDVHKAALVVPEFIRQEFVV